MFWWIGHFEGLQQGHVLRLQQSSAKPKEWQLILLQVGLHCNCTTVECIYYNHISVSQGFYGNKIQTCQQLPASFTQYEHWTANTLTGHSHFNWCKTKSKDRIKSGATWFRYAILNIAWNIIIRELLLHVITTDFTIDLDALAYRSRKWSKWV